MELPFSYIYVSNILRKRISTTFRQFYKLKITFTQEFENQIIPEFYPELFVDN